MISFLSLVLSYSTEKKKRLRNRYIGKMVLSVEKNKCPVFHNLMSLKQEESYINKKLMRYF